jgi:hypothetical protein
LRESCSSLGHNQDSIGNSIALETRMCGFGSEDVSGDDQDGGLCLDGSGCESDKETEANYGNVQSCSGQRARRWSHGKEDERMKKESKSARTNE